jgi:hypothetical protein
MKSHPGAVPLPANDTPFNQQRQGDADQHYTPQSLLTEVPNPGFHQGGDDRGDQKQRSCETAVKRTVATEGGCPVRC